MSALSFTLPWPPSINSMYQQGIIGGVHKKARASMFLSQVGKDYRIAAAEAIDEQRVPRRSLAGRLIVSAIAYPPDARTRDLDNLWKSALDVLKHCNVITDDGHIDDLHVKRAHQVKGGSFVITVGEIVEAFESRQQGLGLGADQWRPEEIAKAKKRGGADPVRRIVAKQLDAMDETILAMNRPPF